MKILLDEGVPIDVGREFEQAKHQVIYFDEVLVRGDGIPDQLVCRASIENKAILVAIDNDMKRFGKRFDLEKDWMKSLDLIHIGCKSRLAHHRIRHFMSLIEHEWDVSQSKTANRLVIELTDQWIKCLR